MVMDRAGHPLMAEEAGEWRLKVTERSGVDEGMKEKGEMKGKGERSSGGWSVRWMRCHLTGPAGRLPAPQRCKLVNMEANYCCPCDQGIIQPYHNTHARTCTRTHAICVDQQRTPTPSDPVASLRTLLLNLPNRRPATPTPGTSWAYRNWAMVRMWYRSRRVSVLKLREQTFLFR